MNYELERFTNLVNIADDQINLAEAALLFAQSEYPDLSITAYLARLDQHAELLHSRAAEDPSLVNRILQLNHFLFVEQAYSGNTRRYYDPRNSFLNQVMDRKLGIPITLSLLYIELARRLDVPVAGLAFPGHFLVRVSLNQGDLIVDPFAGGHLRSREDLEEQLAQTLEVRPHPLLSFEQALVPASHREILRRVLHNLKAIYWQQKAWDKALHVAQYLLALTPEVAGEMRDIGLIYLELKCPQAAKRWLQRYLEADTQAEDNAWVLTQLEALTQPHYRLH